MITLTQPPPPPPKVEASSDQFENPQIQLTVDSESEKKIAIKFNISKTSAQPKHDLNSAMPNINQHLSLDLPTLSLEQLDQLPHLLTPINVNYPRRLVRNGINQVLIKLDVMINQQGQVSLIQIVENPYPELVEEIRKLVRNSRFSPPLKDQSPVNARFIWPVNIKS